MNRRSSLILGLVVVVLLLSSCRRENNSIPPVENQDRIIATANSTDDPSKLLLTWFPVECETYEGVEVELDESYANLRIRVTVDVENCPPGGFNEVTVDLGEPLGERLIWDRAFGDTVALDSGIPRR